MNDGAVLEVPAYWREAADGIIARSCQRTLVLGRSDRGKSSFCRYLLGRLCSSAGMACFVDADIAQKDVGPPACVSLAQFGPTAGEGLDYSDGMLLGLWFVGSVSPQGRFLDLVVGTRRLVERAASLPVVIDTTGLVTGPGHELKRAQIESLTPDAIVMIEQGNELGRLAAEYRHLRILRLPPAASARRRSTAQRREARVEAFGHYFSNAHSTSFGWGRVIIQRGRLRERQLCALADSGGEILGIGVVEGLDKHGFTIHTPVPGGSVAIIQAGRLQMERDWSHRELRGDHGK